MSSFGLTPLGFVVKPQQQIIDDFDAAIALPYPEGLGIAVREQSILGVLRAIFAEALSELWDLQQLVVSQQDPDQAVDFSLESLAALSGTFRDPPRRSTVIQTLTGAPSTLVPEDTRVSDPAVGAGFETAQDTTLVLLTSWVASTGYVVGDRRTNSSRCYECTIAGTSAGSGGPATTASAIVDGGVTWTYLGEGTAAVDVTVQAVETGPTEAPARSLTQIDTAVGGLQSVINLLDAVPGADEQSDESLRVSREEQIANAGAATPDAIRANLLNIAGVLSASVFYNDTDATDGDGVPPHAIEALVQGGDDQAIYDVLLASSVAAGIVTHGNQTGSSEDSEGVSHVVKFSRPVEIEVWVTVTVKKNALTYGGDAAVKEAIVDYGRSLGAGYDAVAVALGAQAFRVPGVLDVPRSGSLGGTLISEDPVTVPVSDATIAVGTREVAAYDTGRIVVNSSNATP